MNDLHDACINNKLANLIHSTVNKINYDESDYIYNSYIEYWKDKYYKWFKNNSECVKNMYYF